MKKQGKKAKKPQKTGLYGTVKNGQMRLTEKGRRFLDQKFRETSITDLVYTNKRTRDLFKILIGRGYNSKEIKDFLHYEFCAACIKWDGKSSSWKTYLTNGIYYGLLRMIRHPNGRGSVRIEAQLASAIYSKELRMESQERDMNEFIENEERRMISQNLKDKLKIILNPQEMEVIKLKCEGMTYKQIGEKLNVTKTRIGQVYSKAVMKIKEFYASEDTGEPEYEF